MNNRIKLAKAMGLTVAPVTLEDCGGPFLVTSDSTLTTSDELVAEWVEWNPLADANDDYAVLEWVRKPTEDATADHHRLLDFHTALRSKMASNYHLGDYARAALKTLEPPVKE